MKYQERLASVKDPEHHPTTAYAVRKVIEINERTARADEKVIVADNSQFEQHRRW